MALKLKINKAEYDKLSEDVKAEYIADGDGFKLDVDGIEDTGPLQRANTRLKADLDDAKDKLNKAETELDELKAARTSTDRDVDRLTKQHEKDMAKKDKEHADAISRRDAAINKLMIDGAAGALAAKISTVPSLMAGKLAERMQVDLTGDEPKLVILKDGKPSDMKIEDLGNEFVANKEYAAIIVGNRARGSGATPTGVPTTGGAGQERDKPQNLATMTGKALADHLAAKKEAANQG